MDSLEDAVNLGIRNLMSAGLGDLEKSVVKATYEDDNEPKPKHVDKLLTASHSHPSDVVNLILKRMVSPKWPIVLKCLIVIHQLTVDGDPSVLEILSKRSALSNMLGSYLDDRSHESKGQSKYIRLYAAYLTEKILVYKRLDRSHEREEKRGEAQRWAGTLSVDSLVKALPVIQKQFDRLLDCKCYADDFVVHAIAIRAVELLLKDAFKVYELANSLFLVILDKYENLNVEQTEGVLACVKIHSELNTKFQEWIADLTRLSLIKKQNVPEFQPIPQTYVDIMSSHLAQLRGEQPTAKVEKEQPKPATKSVAKSPTTQSSAAPTKQPVAKAAVLDFDSMFTSEPIPEKKKEPEPKKAGGKTEDHFSKLLGFEEPAPKEKENKVILDLFGPSTSTNAQSNSSMTAKKPQPVYNDPFASIQSNNSGNPFDPFYSAPAQTYTQPRPVSQPVPASQDPFGDLFSGMGTARR